MPIIVLNLWQYSLLRIDGTKCISKLYIRLRKILSAPIVLLHITTIIDKWLCLYLSTDILTCQMTPCLRLQYIDITTLINTCIIFNTVQFMILKVLLTITILRILYLFDFILY